MPKTHRAPTPTHAVVYRPQLLYNDIERAGTKPALRRAQARATVEYTVNLLGFITLGALLAIIVGLSYAMAPAAERNALTVPTAFSRLQAAAPGSTGQEGTSKVNSLLAFAQTNRPAPHPARPLFHKPAPGLSCQGRTVMNIVAHEDDDLLFINPRIVHDIREHRCVRTVYLTAGDDGRGADYLHLREQGSEAAYSVMLGTTKPWVYRQITLSTGLSLTTAAPLEDDRTSLIFVHLPDGNLDGSGFLATDNQSLSRLDNGDIAAITTVDGLDTYTSAELTDTLAALMQYYGPVRINTQADDAGMPIADHSDHITTGIYATAAAQRYGAAAHTDPAKLLHYFMGYPIRGMASNLSAADTAAKSAAFFAYAIDDTGVCTTMIQCQATNSSYGEYLSRQYITSK